MKLGPDFCCWYFTSWTVFAEPSELDPTLDALNEDNLDGVDGTDGTISALDGTSTAQTVTPAVAETPVEEEKGKSKYQSPGTKKLYWTRNICTNQCQNT